MWVCRGVDAFSGAGIYCPVYVGECRSQKPDRSHWKTWGSLSYPSTVGGSRQSLNSPPPIYYQAVFFSPVSRSHYKKLYLLQGSRHWAPMVGSAYSALFLWRTPLVPALLPRSTAFLHLSSASWQGVTHPKVMLTIVGIVSKPMLCAFNY